VATQGGSLSQVIEPFIVAEEFLRTLLRVFIQTMPEDAVGLLAEASTALEREVADLN